MLLGMSLYAFTLLHVVLSLVGIATGFVVVFGMLSVGRLNHWNGWNRVFLVTTILTSVTGFLFPFARLLPSHLFGVISLVVLAVALVALDGFQLAGRWRSVYVLTSAVALYLNSFVAVVQAFLKISVLRALAPTQTEPAFLVVQLLLLAGFVVMGRKATRSFRPVVV